MRKPIIQTLLPLFCLLFTTYSAFVQVPVLKIDQKEDPAVSLYSLKVDIKITGSLSVTTLEMTFSNSSVRILEGELTIPLPDGASVSRYALDINGKMREAVPVDKAKGTQVFEAIERRRVDPGLLEKVEGNNFRTRIYPIPANGKRQIIIAYEQELSFNKNSELRYHLPLSYKHAIPNFSLEASVIKSSGDPVIESDPGDFMFKEWNQNFTASIQKKDFRPKGSLSFLLPKKESIPELMMQEKENGYYFLVNLYRKASVMAKEKPQEITIIWDVSLSSIDRDIKKEFDLLDEYFKRQKNLLVHLVAFNNYTRRLNDFRIENGNWEVLKKSIASFTYDGGTDYSKIVFPSSDEYLLFTDGLTALKRAEINFPSKPVYTICSSPKSDFSRLKYIAQKTGGSFVNLNTINAEEGFKVITEQPFQIIGYKNEEGIEELYPSLPTAIVNTGSVAGFSSRKNGSFTILLGYGKTVLEEKTIRLNASELSGNAVDLEKVWAQKKINEMDIQYENNKIEIERLGKNYGIVTRNTSLIVLETINDYVLYEIEPPTELREEYDRIMKQKNQFTQTQERTINNNAKYHFNLLRDWYGVPTEKNEEANLEKVARNESIQGAPGAAALPSRRQESNLQGVLGSSAQLSEVVVVGYGDQRKRLVTGSMSTVNSNDLNKSNSFQNALNGKVAGVQIVSSNSTGDLQTYVRIRGAGSLNGDMPQFILNGRPASWDEVQSLDPSDIESIQIQKTGYYFPTTTNRTHIYFHRKDPTLPIVNWRKLDYMSDNSRAIFRQKDFTIREPYIAELERSPDSLRYEKYLFLRNNFLHSPAFYFNVATWFFENDDYETGMTILQNLGEMELQDHELYKMLAYKLKEMGEYELAMAAYKKVLDWRPMEPQSYRDYGLALQDAGFYQQALDTLCLSLNRNYAADVAGLYPGIEEMIVTEINQLISLHKNLHLPKSLDKSLLQEMPVDLRVVANWNMNDTDLDLWVTDPLGEKCYYSHKNTQIGGRLSNDFTRGYGPEQFLLKKAVKGKYKVQVNFYGQTAVKLVGATTVEAEIFIHYSSKNQERQVVSFQTSKQGNNIMLVGEFEIK